MNIKDQEIIVLKHLFNGTFWTGSKWIIPSTYEELMECNDCILDKQLEELCKEACVDSFHCRFTSIIIQMKFIF
jgi:hypothetical protein